MCCVTGGLLLGMIVGKFGVPDATDPSGKTGMMIVTRLTDGVVHLLACP